MTDDGGLTADEMRGVDPQREYLRGLADGQRSMDALALALQHFLQDGDWSEKTTSDADCERIEELLVEPLLKLICKHVGHQVVPDHCNKPDHDYCNRCRETRPGEAART